jgi:hypothetical protein
MGIRKAGILIVLAILWVSHVWGGEVLARPDTRDGKAIPTQPDRHQLGSYGGSPAYDSGWQTLGPRPDPISVLFTHNLGGDEDTYLVTLECQDDTSLGTFDCTDQAFNVNAHWYGLTNTTVSAWVAGGTRPDAIRVRIYTNVPEYDSGWEVLGARPDPIPVPFTHNLGGDPDDYIVSLQCRDDTSLGTYDCTDQGFVTNAHWYGLSNTSVTAWVASGTRPDEVRIRIYTQAPAYDSGWYPLGVRPDPIAVGLAHNLGGDLDSYVVSLECRDDTTLGTYDCTNQGFDVQAHWYGLTETTVSVYVVGGTQPDDLRVRIWRIENVYLPVVVRS